MEIYRIYNKLNGKSYIGMTKWSFGKRYHQGKWWKWTHSNHLKKAVEKHGLDNFRVEILHSSAKTEEELAGLEKAYIKQYSSKIPNGYNLTDGGGSSQPSYIKEYEIIDCYGNIYCVKNLSEFCQKNKLNYSAMLNMVNGIWPHSQGFALMGFDIEEIPNPSKIYNFENIYTGEICEIKRKDINSFGKSKGSRPSSLYNIISGNIIANKQGWKLKETILPKNYRGSDTKYKDIQLMKDDGSIIIIKDGIYKFAKENNLDRGAIYDLINGRHLYYKGYRLPSTPKDFENKKSERLGRFVDLIRISTGQTLRIKNVSKFCRDNQINLNSFNSMIGGRTKSYADYRLA